MKAKWKCELPLRRASLSNKEGHEDMSDIKKEVSEVKDGKEVEYDDNSAMESVKKSVNFNNCSFFVTKESSAYSRWIFL